jgi:hypothetical protein
MTPSDIDRTYSLKNESPTTAVIVANKNPLIRLSNVFALKAKYVNEIVVVPDVTTTKRPNARVDHDTCG